MRRTADRPRLSLRQVASGLLRPSVSFERLPLAPVPLVHDPVQATRDLVQLVHNPVRPTHDPVRPVNNLVRPPRDPGIRAHVPVPPAHKPAPLAPDPGIRVHKLVRRVHSPAPPMHDRARQPRELGAQRQGGNYLGLFLRALRRKRYDLQSINVEKMSRVVGAEWDRLTPHPECGRASAGEPLRIRHRFGPQASLQADPQFAPLAGLPADVQAPQGSILARNLLSRIRLQRDSLGLSSW